MKAAPCTRCVELAAWYNLRANQSSDPEFYQTQAELLLADSVTHTATTHDRPAA